MIDKSIDELFKAIDDSNEYREYLEARSLIEKNKEVMSLINDIKSLQKKAVKLEYAKDDSAKEVDKIIKEKTDKLNRNSDYQTYLDKQKKLNSLLKASSSLIEDYLHHKISIDI